MLTVDFAKVATELVSRGFAVIPLQQGAKDPDFRLVGKIDGVTGTGGATRRTRSLQQIEEWATASPNANVGVCSDEVITILESDNEVQFRQLIRDVSRNLFGVERELPSTLTSQARENRPHFFFKATSKTNAIEGAPGIQGLFEWRRLNQYVVGPGSLHPTGVPYRIINDAPIQPMPDWLVDVLMEIKSAYHGETSRASKYVQVGPAAVVKAALVNEYNMDPHALLADDSFEIFIGAGERHYFLQAMAGLLHDGERTADDLIEILTAMRDKYCEPGKGDYEIKSIAHWQTEPRPDGSFVREPTQIEPLLKPMNKGLRVYSNQDSYDAAPEAEQKPKHEKRMTAADLDFRYPKVAGAIQQYTLEAKDTDGFDGWFPRGRPSAVAGSSGTGKSTLMLDLLRRQVKREYILGHRGAGLRWLVIWADRGALANEETLKRMRIAKDEVNIAYIGGTIFGVPAIREIKEQMENYEEHELPQVVFVEGGDMLIEDNNKKPLVAEFLQAAQKLAEHYHCALIFSVGSPKTNKSNSPVARRDNIIGSEQWGRAIDTAVVITFEDDGTGDRRKMSVQHRNAGAEMFDMEFQNGLLVEAPKPVDDAGNELPKVDPFWQLIEQQDGEFIANDIAKVCAQMGLGSPSTLFRRVEKYIAEGKLGQRIDRKTRYLKVAGVRLG